MKTTMRKRASGRLWRSESRSGQGSSASAPESMDYEITPEEVKSKLDAGETFTLLDVASPGSLKAARIDGAS